MASRRRAPLLVVIVLVSALVSATASADPAVVVRTDPGGALLSGATTLKSSSSDQVTMYMVNGIVTCTQNALHMTLDAAIGGTNITGRLNALTFSSCAGSTGLVTLTGCGLHAPSMLTVRSNATGGGFTLSPTILRCPVTSSSSACYYSLPSQSLPYVNATGTLTISPSTSATAVTPTGDALPATTCAPSGTVLISATATHLTDQGGTAVTLATG